MPDVNAVNPSVEEIRAELTSVLSTPAFARSTRAARLLEYLCEKSLAGCADEIKEYNIAVDVLGRPPSFDPANDASARVEVHRLRKKLRDYYDGDGRENSTRIVIPTGSYAPVFSRPEIIEPPAPEPEPPAIEPAVVHVLPPSAPVALPAAPRLSKKPRWLIPGLAAALFALLAGGIWYSRSASGTSNALRARRSAVPIPAGQPTRILCGRAASLVDPIGRTWEADRYFIGGRTVSSPVPVRGSRAAEVFGGAREGQFGYDIPLKPGVYELRLYFAETRIGVGDDTGGEGSRVFHVSANGQRLLSDFDIITDAGGPEVADIRAFKDISPADDGLLHLQFIQGPNDAVVSAIELFPARKGLLNPIRMVAQNGTYTDPEGRKWMPEDSVTGGRLDSHLSAAANLPGIYSSERYGRFTYDIPAPQGAYDVTIHMAETYWGVGDHGGGAGSRVFDIFCNGVALARNVDVYARAGAGKPLVLRYEKLRPNAQGKLHISFVPVKNYATVCALEINDADE